MEGYTAVVTGGSRGIGAAVASLFGSEGAHVVVCGRDAEALETVAADVREAGGTALARRADVRDEFDVERLLGEAARETGSIDLVVANAGVYRGHPGDTTLAAESYATFDDHLRTNARGVYATIREAVPHLGADARILVPSGGVARDPKPGYGSYAVSKAAAEAVARGFAVELEQVVSVIDPGQVTTELTDGGPGREPDAVAPMFRWAALEAPADELDGAVVGLGEWRRATR